MIKKLILMGNPAALLQRRKTMKGKGMMAWAFTLGVVFIVALIFPIFAHADASGGGSNAVSVADAVHGAGDVASLAEQFNAVMDQFDREESADRRRALLEEANNMLAKLVAQANDVESEVAILSEKKLDRVYAAKLDRVLASVQRMRKAAEDRFAAANQAS
jgi:hypothetical protein